MEKTTNKYMIPLREYQKKSVDEFYKAIKKGNKRLLIQQPTGGGKSVILAEIMKKWLLSGKRILIIAHKIELIKQLEAHVKRWHDFDSSILADRKQYSYDPNRQVIIASIQSWSYRYSKQQPLPPADLILIDEAHHSASKSYSNLFQNYEGATIVGFTATPQRLDGKGLRFLHKGTKGFQKIINGVQVRELMDDGFLSEYRLFSAGRLIDASAVKITAGDYNQKDLETVVRDQIPPEEVVTTWQQLAQDKKTVIYPVSVELSKVYCQAFKKAGIASAHIDAKTPPRIRAGILEDFRLGKITVLCQHSIIIEGVDVPDIECVQFVRPTKSMVVWFQAIGRSLRPAPNKPFAIIIDHTTTHQELPMPDVPQKWRLDAKSFYVEDHHVEGENYLECVDCGFTWRPHKDKEMLFFKELHREQVKNEGSKPKVKIQGIITPCWCPKCNYKHTEKPWAYYEKSMIGEKIVEILQAKETKEVDPNAPNEQVIEQLKELIETQKAKRYHQGWVQYKALEISNIGYGDLLWLSEQLGYRKAWASYRYQEILDNKGKVAHEN